MEMFAKFIHSEEVGLLPVGRVKSEKRLKDRDSVKGHRGQTV